MLSRLTIGSRILVAILFTAALAAVIAILGVVGVRSIQRSMHSKVPAARTDPPVATTAVASRPSVRFLHSRTPDSRAVAANFEHS